MQFDSLTSSPDYTRYITHHLTECYGLTFACYHRIHFQQTNGYDCGVLALSHVRMITSGNYSPLSRGKLLRTMTLSSTHPRLQIVASTTTGEAHIEREELVNMQTNSQEGPHLVRQNISTNQTASTSRDPIISNSDRASGTPEVYIRSRQCSEITQSNAKRKKSTLPSQQTPKPKKLRQKKITSYRIARKPEEFFLGNTLLPPRKKHLRILFQNVSTLSLSNNAHVTKESFEGIASHHYDIVCLSEINVNINHPRFANTFASVINPFTSYESTNFMHTPGFSDALPLQPGCQLIAYKENLQKRIRTQPHVIYGRWQITSIQATARIINLLTLYCPSPGKGHTTIYQQLRNVMYSMNDDRDVIQAFFADLSNAVSSLLQDSSDLIVAGDFNDHFVDSKHMTQVLDETPLVNYAYFKSDNPPPTFLRGTKPVDHVWVTSSLIEDISNFGFLPKKEYFEANHRGIFLDVNVGTPVYNSSPQFGSRGINSGNVKSRGKYLDAIAMKRQKFNLLGKIQNTMRDEGEIYDYECKTRRMDSFDDILTKWMLSQEKIQIPPPWKGTCITPRIKILRNERHYWRVLKHFHETPRSISYLQRYYPDHVDDNLHLSVNQLRYHMRDVERRLHEATENASEERESWLKGKLEKFTITKEDSRANIIRHIIKSESKRKKLTKGKRAAKQSTFQFPQYEDGDMNIWERLKLRNEQPETWKTSSATGSDDDILLDWNRNHFRQCLNSPLGHLPYLDHLTNDLEAQQSEMKKCMCEDPLQTEWLNSLLETKSPTEPSLSTVTSDDFREFIKKASENKLTSPSGRHLGHTKSIVHDPKSFACMFYLLEFAIHTKRPLPRWRSVHQVLLPKDKDSFKIHRLRNITIVESDLQFLMTHTWSRQLGRKIKKKSLLNENQYAQKGKLCLSNVLMKNISYTLQLTDGNPSYTYDLDAANCFDRVIPIVALFASVRLGLSYQTGSFLVILLRSLRHFFVLGGRVTDNYFSSSISNPLFGLGQGTGWAPLLWIAVLDSILDVLKGKPKTVFTSPLTGTLTATTVEAYMDDAHGGVNMQGRLEYNNTMNQQLTLLESAPLSLQTFERCLSFKGGKLNLSKCHYYHLHPTIKDNKLRFFTQCTNRLPFHITDSE